MAKYKLFVSFVCLWQSAGVVFSLFSPLRFCARTMMCVDNAQSDIFVFSEWELMTPITGDDISCAKRTHVWEWLCVYNRCSIRHSVLNPSGNIKGVWRIFTCQSDSKPKSQKEIVWCDICNSTVIALPGDVQNDINELNICISINPLYPSLQWHGSEGTMVAVITWLILKLDGISYVNFSWLT